MAPPRDIVQTYDTLLLEYLQVMVTNAVSRQELVAGRMELLERRAMVDSQQMVASLCYYIAGQKETASVDYPRDWWEALKQRFAPRWLTQRWPVRLTTFTVDAWRFWQNAPKVDGWKPEYRMVVPRPMSIRFDDKENP